MSVTAKSNYSGEFLQSILTMATTGNELVSRGLIHIISEVKAEGVSIPRMRIGEILQKRKETPTEQDSKGDITYDEKRLMPKDFMAFTTFNPRTFERVWRPFQPKGNLVFSELPTEVQEKLVELILKQVNHEVGYHMINGRHGEGEGEFFDGLLTNILSDNSVIRATAAEETMLARLSAVYNALPEALNEHPNLRILMSVKDFNRYDRELTELHHKGADTTMRNSKLYKGIKIETLPSWPEGVIVATLCGMDETSTNLFAACNLSSDADVILVEKISPASERYFFKLLLTMDTGIAFGEYVVLLDARQPAKIDKFIRATPDSLIIPKEGGEGAVIVRASGAYDIAGTHAGFEVSPVEGGIIIKAEANETGSDRTGTIELQLKGSSEHKAIIELLQGDGK